MTLRSAKLAMTCIPSKSILKLLYHRGVKWNRSGVEVKLLAFEAMAAGFEPRLSLQFQRLDICFQIAVDWSNVKSDVKFSDNLTQTVGSSVSLKSEVQCLCLVWHSKDLHLRKQWTLTVGQTFYNRLHIYMPSHTVYAWKIISLKQRAKFTIDLVMIVHICDRICSDLYCSAVWQAKLKEYTPGNPCFWLPFFWPECIAFLVDGLMMSVHLSVNI